MFEKTYDIVNKLLSVHFHKFFKIAYKNYLYFIIENLYTMTYNDKCL